MPRLIIIFLLFFSILGSSVASAAQAFQSVYLQSDGSVLLRKQLRKWVPETKTDNPEIAFQALRAGRFLVDQDLRVKDEEGAWYAFRYYVEPDFPDHEVLLRFIVGRNYEADVYVLQQGEWKKSHIPDFRNPQFESLLGGGYALRLPADENEEYWVLIKPDSKFPVVLRTELTSERGYYQSMLKQQVPLLASCGAVLAMMGLVLAWRWRNPQIRIIFLILGLVSIFSRLLHYGYFSNLSQMWWFNLGEIYTALFMLEQIFFLGLILSLVNIKKECLWLKFSAFILMTSFILLIPISLTEWGTSWFVFSIFRFLIVFALVLEFVLAIRAVLIGNPSAIYVTLATLASFCIICFQVWKNIDLLQSELVYLIVRDTTFSLMMMVLTIAILRYGKKPAVKHEGSNKAAIQELTNAWANDIYTLSQELRTPTTGVIGMAQLLQRSGLDNSQRHYANVIVASTNEIVDTLGAVQDITRINSKNFQLDAVPFSIEQLFQFLADFFEFDLTEVESHIDGKFSDKMPLFFVGDQVRLQEVLAIAMRTLLRFTNERLALNITNEEQTLSSNVSLRFVIDAKDLRLSQEAKQRFVDILKESEDGLMLFGGARGSAELGLVLIKKIVREMNGEIGIDLSPGRAVSLWFTVKLMVDFNKQLKFDRDQAQLRNKRLAVIYSSQMFAENMVRHFSAWGIDAHAVNDNDDWQKFDIEDYDLLTISNSCKWPVAKILQLAAAKNIPVLLSDGINNNQLAFTDLPRMRVAHMSMGSTLSEITTAMVSLLTHRDVMHANKITQSVGQLSQFKVLVAEDNPVNQQVIMAMLRNLGVDADCVSDGSEVLPLIFDRPEYYDLILMDYDMPQMNGIETARALRMRRRNSAFKPLTICCLTAHATSEIREQCIAAGMDAVLVKPINMSILEEYLRSVFARLDSEVNEES
jgi:CheY-like chemotaxis protein/signal transduction histidine kinase